MGRVNRPIRASTTLLPPSGLTSGGTLPYGTLTRTGAGATYVDPYGTVQPAAANVARINNSQLVATNYMQNPRFEGGAYGVSPALYAFSTVPGVTSTVLGVGTYAPLGLPYVDLRYQGTPTTDNTITLFLATTANSNIPGVLGETVSFSCYLMLMEGSAVVNAGGVERDSVGTFTGSLAGSNAGVTTAPTYVLRSRTLTGATTTGFQPTLSVNVLGGTPVYFVLRIMGLQGARAATTSSVVALPASGTTGVSASYVRPRILIEEARTNAIRNPRAEGAITGTPGTNPTNWTDNLTGSGMTGSVVATGTESGIPYIDYRITGTATANIFPTVWVETTNAIATAVGNLRSTTMYLRLVAGSWANVSSVGMGGYEYNAVPTFLASNSGTVAFPTVAPLVTQRTSYNATMLQATTAFWQPFFVMSILLGSVVDVTFRIGTPQDESGVNSTSLILPSAGVPAATARGNDLYNIPTAGWIKYGASVSNLMLQSQTMDNASWNKSAGVVVTPDTTTAPDSLLTADTWTEAAASGNSLNQTRTYVTGNIYTFSVYCKPAVGTRWLSMLLTESGTIFGGVIPSATFNPTTGTFASVQAGCTATVQALASGWWRFAVTTPVCVAGAVTNVGFRMAVNSTDIFGGAGDGTGALYLWGAQWEIGTSPSAYMTTTTTVSASRTKLAAGTLVVRSRLFYTPPTGAIYGIFTLSDGTANSRIGMRYTPTAIASVLITNLVSSTGPTGMASVPQPATTYTQGLSWDDTGVTSVVNGVGASTAVNVPMPTGVTTLHIGQGTAGGFVLVGEVDYVTYYPYRMNSVQLAAVTA
jgi:hypothetical protein